MKQTKLDELDKKLFENFAGRVVRKDLVRKMKSGINVPVYVLEYLIGKYCSSTDPEIIEEGEKYVKEMLSEHYFRPDESEKIKSYIKERSSHNIIDKVKVRLVETENKYWAEVTILNLKYINIEEKEVKKFEKMLEGGIWAIIEMGYDEEVFHKGANRPFFIKKIKPIQSASIDLEEIRKKRNFFTRDEWLNIIIRSIGIEPIENDFPLRLKLLLISRLIPLAENNFNLLELGYRGTGKSFVYREISPFSILISGGKTTVANLFMNLSTGKIGLVGLWDTVAFDEIAGLAFKNIDALQILKDYMESGSFSRGKEEITANASLVFIGNINEDVKNILKMSHLFSPLPIEMQDMALLDRIHFYFPGWEIPKMQPEFFSFHYGFVVDYFSELLREFRKLNYTDIIENYFLIGSHLNQRDSKAVKKTVSGLLKILHPDGNFSKTDVEEYLIFALEMRRRVKEQLKKMGGMEYWAVNFSYIDIDTNEEKFVEVPEQISDLLIPDKIYPPGIIFTIGTDREEKRYCLFRIEVQSMKGSGNKKITGAPSSAMKDAIQTAFDFTKANINKLMIEKNFKDYDLHIQIVNLMQSKDGTETGVAFFVSILSNLLEKPVNKQLVILGEMTIHGGLLKVNSLIEKLQLALDSGAKFVLLPSINKNDIVSIPSDILDKINIIFYSDPINGAYRALGIE